MLCTETGPEDVSILEKCLVHICTCIGRFLLNYRQSSQHFIPEVESCRNGWVTLFDDSSKVSLCILQQKVENALFLIPATVVCVCVYVSE